MRKQTIAAVGALLLVAALGAVLMTASGQDTAAASTPAGVGGHVCPNAPGAPSNSTASSGGSRTGTNATAVGN